jgi:hypothetical protein
MTGEKRWMRLGRYGESFVVAASPAGDSRFVAHTVAAWRLRASGVETAFEL